jgi:hypothetical protein
VSRLEWHVVTPEEQAAREAARPADYEVAYEPDPCPAVEEGAAEPGSCRWVRLSPWAGRIGPVFECETCGNRTD